MSAQNFGNEPVSRSTLSHSHFIYEIHVNRFHCSSFHRLSQFITFKAEDSYNYHNYGLYSSPCLLFKTQLNSIGLSVSHRKHITSPLGAQQVNAIYRCVTMIHLLFKTQLNSIGLSVPHKKHITSPPRAQQVNAIHMYVYISITMTILDILHRPVFYLKHNVSETEFYLRVHVEPTYLGPIDRAIWR
jgi:hypothetical protein